MLLDNSSLTWNRNFIPNSDRPGAALNQPPHPLNLRRGSVQPRNADNLDLGGQLDGCLALLTRTRSQFRSHPDRRCKRRGGRERTRHDGAGDLLRVRPRRRHGRCRRASPAESRNE